MTWVVGSRIGAEMFSARTRASKPGPVLKPKKCACGKNVFAKQLTQYGKCPRCVRAAHAGTSAPNETDK